MSTKAPNRRKDVRIGISLPVKVQGYNAEGMFQEMTATADAGSGGASFNMKRTVEVGQVLRLELPLPKAFRAYALNDATYATYALVRNVSKTQSGVRVGVWFLGKRPPGGYERNRTGRYLFPGDPMPAAKDRRKWKRLDIHLNLRLKRIGASSSGPNEELTVAENIGKGGARVLTTLQVAKGDVLMMEETDGEFRTRVEVRSVYIGKDNVPRLNLRFLDAEAPDRLVATD